MKYWNVSANTMAATYWNNGTRTQYMALANITSWGVKGAGPILEVSKPRVVLPSRSPRASCQTAAGEALPEPLVPYPVQSHKLLIYGTER